MARPATGLFPSQYNPNGHIGADSVRRASNAALEESGLSKHLTPHCLRHAFATHLLEAGVSADTMLTVAADPGAPPQDTFASA